MLLLATSSDAPVRSNNLFLRHKTSIRARYDAAWRNAEAQGAFDTAGTGGAGHAADFEIE